MSVLPESRTFKVCLSKLKKNVHGIEATSPGASESALDHSQSSCDHVLWGAQLVQHP